MHFISIEAAVLQYLFAPSKPVHPGYKALQDDLGSRSHAVQPMLPWRFNHLHDLESLWWVAVWIVFNNCFGKLDDSLSSSQEPEVPLTPQAPPDSIRAALFPSSLENVHRRDFFISRFSEIQGLPEQYLMPFNALDIIRSLLIEHYEKIQSTLPTSINLNASSDDIYDYFMQVFNLLRQGTPNHTLMSIPTVRADMQESKRKRDEPTDSMGRSSWRRSVV